jgi:hypothetical protein
MPLDAVVLMPLDMVSHRGVGTVSMRPSEWIMVLVPLPFGTTIAEPPPGVVVVW